MSRFFKNLDSEKESVKKKSSVIFSVEEKETVSKKDKKKLEFDGKIEELLKIKKRNIFDKSVKKFFVDSKKYIQYFDSVVPDSLNKLIADERISEDALELSKEFIQLIDNKKQPIEEIKKSEKIIKNHEKTKENDKEKILKLFVANSRVGNVSGMIDIILLGFDSSSEEVKELYKKKLNIYLEKIYLLLTDIDFDKYEKLLEKVKKFNFDLGTERILEFKMIKKNENVENDHKIFKVLYYIRNGDFTKAKEFIGDLLEIFDLIDAENFKSNLNTPFKDLYLIIKKYYPSLTAVLYEYSYLAGSKGEYLEMYSILSKIYFKTENNGILLGLYALSIVLNESIKGDLIFTGFLEKFKTFDENIFVLESNDEFNEIYRAFYLFNMWDYKESSNIIKNICGFSCENELKTAIYNKL